MIGRIAFREQCLMCKIEVRAIYRFYDKHSLNFKKKKTFDQRCYSNRVVPKDRSNQPCVCISQVVASNTGEKENFCLITTLNIT